MKLVPSFHRNINAPPSTKVLTLTASHDFSAHRKLQQQHIIERRGEASSYSSVLCHRSYLTMGKKNRVKVKREPAPPPVPPPIDGLASSPLGRLSPEIRNHIYELALTRPVPFLIGINTIVRRLPQARLKDVQYHILRRESRGLLLSCRGISAECTQFFHAANTFAFTGSKYRFSVDTLESFLNRIGRIDTSALRHVPLAVEVVDSWELDRFGYGNE